MASAEEFANNAQTTLMGMINSSATTLTVVSGSGFPVPQFRLLIDSELLLVDSIFGITWTVTRGIEGTTAAAHASGALATMVLTAGAIQEAFVRGDSDRVTAGAGSSGSGGASVAIGYNASAIGTAVGGQASANHNFAVALGEHAQAGANNSTASGSYSTASGYYATAVGTHATAAANSVALGGGATASGAYSDAIGSFATASGKYSTVVGANASASGEYGVAIGYGVSAGAASQVVIGNPSGSFTLAPGTTGLSATVYSGDNLAGNGLSSVVGNVALQSQTGAISPTSISTPAANGTYRVSVYAVTTTAGSAGTVSVAIGWTDDAQAQTITLGSALSLASAGAFMQATAYIRAKTTAPIKYTTTVSGVGGSPQYSLYINVERLS